MPWRPDPDPDLNYTFVIGECQRQKAPAGMTRYLVASIRGVFTIDEASTFFVALLDDDRMPFYQDYFAHPRIRVHTIGFSIDPPFDHPKYQKVGWYINHYSPVAYISEYEWNVARHDIHEFLNPNIKSRVFGDLIPN